MDDHAPLIERAFALDVREHASAATGVSGALPPWLRGTCYLNGPGRFARGDVRYRHWLDGDGMICALELGDGGARLSNRFVRSDKFVREESAGRALFRAFGTAFPGDELKRGIGLVSPVNVSVYPHGGALLAFGEQGLPWEIDARTLETRGPFTFGGRLNDITPFSAHPKVDHRTGELFNFGVSFSPRSPLLNVFRFDADNRLLWRTRLPLPYPASIHDFAISERHLVFYVSPLVLAMDALLNGATVMDALRWQPELGSRLVIVDRDSGAAVAAIDAGDRYCLHLVNAFEDGAHLVVDLVEFDRPLYPEYQVIPNLFTDTFRGRPVRLVVDPAGGAILDRRALSYDCSPDFPAHDPALTGRPYEHFWMLGISRAGRAGRKFFDQLVRMDWEDGAADVYQAPAGRYLGGEPVYVPGPDGGVVLCQAFDAGPVASSFLVFDAFGLSAGPVATIGLPSAIPLLFHSVFSAG